MEHALYDEREGFFGRGGGAGRAGRDFVTSPEVGVLFGALVARALDRWWEELETPDPFVVVDAGAGRGRLAADVMRADPGCSSALRYVMVERSPVLRAAQRELLDDIEPAEDALGPALRTEPDEAVHRVPGVGPIVTALADLPALELEGVVVANELLDNLPFRVVERGRDGWNEVRVGVHDDAFVETVVPAPPDLVAATERVAVAAAIPEGARLPVPTGTATWMRRCGELLRRGFLLVLDYADDAASLAGRGQAEWLRTYREHHRGASPLIDPGAQDITCDVPVEHLLDAARRAGFRLVEHTRQRDWLTALGIDALAAEGAARWQEGAAVGDLAAVAGRSRVHEADALIEESGLGAHHVFVFEKDRPG